MRIFLCLFIGVFLGACNSDDNTIITSPFLGEAYVPLVEGSERIFLMDSIVFGTEGDIFFKDTTVYYLKELVEESLDFDGRQFIAIDQYKSESLSGPWTFYKRVYDLIEDSSYRRIDENLELVYFAFPPYLGKSWNTASLINQSIGIPIGTNYVKIYEKWDEAFMIDFYPSYDLGQNLLDSVFHVEYVNFENVSGNFVEVRFEERFFAINRGLVKRQIRMLYSKYNTGGILDYENFIEAGYQLEQTLIFQ